MPFRTYVSGNAAAFTITPVMTSYDLNIHTKVMKIFLYTHRYSMSHVCKYDIYPFLSLGGVREVTYIQTDRQTERDKDGLTLLI